ncbi:MAG: histidine phosphatase family protein, partial [Pseudanabaenales cyanobacterium]|nr:histidine phosphatase family protein [Pseudanabaenales cyanobacterium]
QIQQLATLLKPVTLHFSLSSDLDSCQITAQQILQHHPGAVQRQVLPEAFPFAWRQTIDAIRPGAVSAAANHQLVTGLVVASAAIIEPLLGQTLGLDSDHLWRLPLQPGTLSLIHYPSTEHPPVLQAMNICEHLLGITR